MGNLIEVPAISFHVVEHKRKYQAINEPSRATDGLMEADRGQIRKFYHRRQPDEFDDQSRHEIPFVCLNEFTQIWGNLGVDRSRQGAA
jgi:hypothetical protein